LERRIKSKTRLTLIRFIQPGIMTVISMILAAPVILAAGPDIKPPKIAIISSLKDSQVESGKPLIEISYSDPSGINEETVHLFVDRIEVTTGAVTEQEDVTGQAVDSPWHITYSSEVALSKGKHEVRLSVEDMAGNRAELSWNFEVIAGAGGNFLISGENTLRIDESPIEEMTDTYYITAGERCGETDIRLNAGGKITNYPGSETEDYYHYNEYNFYLDEYSLGVYRRQASAVAGRNINASLDSELLQVGLTLKGAIAADTFDGPGGAYHWTAFSGDSGSSYGTSAVLYDMTGAGGDWRANSGNLELGAYYVDLSGSKTYQYTGIRGITSLMDFGLLRFETIYGSYDTGDQSGLGWALHWDKSLAGCDLGLDYTELQPDYPVYGVSSLIESSNRGVRTYEIRTSATVTEKQRLSLDCTYTQDNLDNTYGSTETHRYITAGYDYRPDTGFSLNADYQGDFENTQSSSHSEDKEDHSFTLGMGQNIGTSKIKISYTLNAARYPEADGTYDGSRILSSWTCPIGENNLTPSVQWTYKKYADGEYSKTVEARLTWDRKFYSDLPRSSVALFYRVTDELDGEQVINYGVLPSIHIKIGAHSTLTLVYDYKWYRQISEDTDGIDTIINLTWKLTF
jgi:hypothetical protein